MYLSIDLLEDEYFSGQRLKFKAKNQSDFVVSGEADLTPLKLPTASLTVNKPGSIISLDKLRIKSDGKLLTEISLKTSSFSKIVMNAEDGRQEPGKPIRSFGKLGFELNLPSWSIDADVDVVNGPLLYSSILYKYDNFKFGGETLINTHLEDNSRPTEIMDINAGFSYACKDWLLVAKTTNVFENIRLSYLHNISPKLILATQVNYDLKSNSQKLAIGTSYL